MQHKVNDKPTAAAPTGMTMTLRYSGHKLTALEEERGLQGFIRNFSEIGALAIRYQLGQGLRAGLLQQIARDNYDQNTIEMAAPGINQTGLFVADAKHSTVRATIKKLEEISHYTLGRGKILNERTQPIVNRNNKGIRGEQAIFDILHNPVWNSGSKLAQALSKQGFEYVSCPDGMNEETYLQVSKALKAGKFTIEIDKVRVKFDNQDILLDLHDISKIRVTLDPALDKLTSPRNGLAVTTEKNDKPKSLGWIISESKNTCLPVEITAGIMRIMIIAHGGFHKLSKAQIKLLLQGLLAAENNPELTLTQNRSFNAMITMFKLLEEAFDFDASVLIPISTFNTQKLSLDKLNASEDFLVGELISEMVETLRTTQSNSVRRPLPHQFASSSYSTIANTTRAIAYAYDLTDSKGNPLLQFKDEKALKTSVDAHLIDNKVNGQLRNPHLQNPKHLAALLSSGILIAEQIILEQLLRDACRYGDAHPNAIALKAILKNNALGNTESVYAELISMAKKLPKNAAGPILGLQLPYCEPLVEKLRAALGFGHVKSNLEKAKALVFGARKELIEVTIALFEGNEKEAQELINQLSKDKNIENELRNIFNIGLELQKLPGITGVNQQSRGINAGIILVIEKLAPNFYKELIAKGIVNLVEAPNQQQAPAAALAPASSTAQTTPAAPAFSAGIASQTNSAVSCPFFRNMDPNKIPAGAKPPASHTLMQPGRTA